MPNTMNITEVSPRTRAELVAAWRRLSRSMADESLSDSDFNALQRARDAVQAEIDALDLTQA